MREAGQKHLGKKYIEPTFGKVNEGDQKQTLDKFLEKLK